MGRWARDADSTAAGGCWLLLGKVAKVGGIDTSSGAGGGKVGWMDGGSDRAARCSSRQWTDRPVRQAGQGAGARQKAASGS